MAQLKVGDVVELKSGSPKMTITDSWQGDDGIQFFCSYFSQKEGKTQTARFPPDALRKVDE